MLTREELKSLVRVAPLALAEECAIQPELFLEASELASDARSAMEKAKSDLEQTESLVDFEIRSGRIDYSGLKLTDITIAQLIKREMRVKEARKVYLDSCSAFRKAEGLAAAFDQKRSMLSYITDLTLRGQAQSNGVQSSIEKRIADARSARARGNP